MRADLKTYSKRLLDYAERGGNLIYQYQTQEFDAAPYGPYPYKLTARAQEVSEEDAPVTILEPSHPVFHWPNTITEADFNGWVEERGSKWMTTWDERYTPLLESHDRQQPPQRVGCCMRSMAKAPSSTQLTLFTGSCQRAWVVIGYCQFDQLERPLR